ncbi:hypothetical protein [Synechococcus sp. CBW1108]|nr:hypothetical protein [Synechococcus sp. CBW1108]
MARERRLSLARQTLPARLSSLRQQGRDVWQFLEQAWIAHHRGE